MSEDKAANLVRLGYGIGCLVCATYAFFASPSVQAKIDNAVRAIKSKASSSRVKSVLKAVDAQERLMEATKVAKEAQLELKEAGINYEIPALVRNGPFVQ
jgi:hypothetical protein